jgi:hypothetical protein
MLIGEGKVDFIRGTRGTRYFNAAQIGQLRVMLQAPGMAALLSGC